jgi:DNA-directed RNA polymerase specialized sigma24 family protein
MGLSNSETSHILGVTTEAVKKAKQRLRKKYSTKQDILGFEQFLN